MAIIPMALESIQANLIGEGKLISAADEMIFDRKFRARHRFILGESGVHYAASLIDPHVQGRGLSTEQTLKGELEKE